MAWDDNKSRADDPTQPDSDEQITAEEWNNHVAQGHWPSDELKLKVLNDDPVVVDSQNNDSVVMRYDRDEGSWVIPSVNTGEVATDRTWQDVTTSRSINTLEQNNTNGEIKASVVIVSNSDGTLIGASWDNDVENSDVVDSIFDSGERATLQTTIPAGASYKINQFQGEADSSLSTWIEFRP